MTDPRRPYFEEHAARWDATWSGAGKEERLASILVELGLPGERLLDIGTGTGILLPFLAGEREVVALDFARSMLEEARTKHGARAEYVQADVHALPFAGRSFDGAVAFAALPHFRDKAAALGEICRVLKGGAPLIILHLAGSWKITSLHAGAGGAVAEDALPPPGELAETLAAAGFAPERLVDEESLYLAVARRRTT